MEPEPSRPELLPDRVRTQVETALRNQPKLALSIGVAIGAVVLAAAMLLLRPGRAQVRRHVDTSGVHAVSAVGPGKATPATVAGSAPAGATATVPGTPLPLTPINPALVNFQPSPDLLMRGPENPSRVALTFDAGSDAKAVPLLLKILQERHVHATFFLTGRFCEKFPNECRAIADAGMELGNHSYRHPRFTRLSEAKILNELERSEAAIVKACGRGAKPLFRFPYGDCDERTQRIVAAAGYQPIRWTLDSLDAFGKPKTEDFVVDRINSRVKPGYITLMHVSCVTSAEALPRIFAQLDTMGARVVPVSELLLGAAPEALPDAAASREQITH